MCDNVIAIRRATRFASEDAHYRTIKSCSYKRPYDQPLRPTLALRLTTLGRTPGINVRRWHHQGTSKTFTGTQKIDYQGSYTSWKTWEE